MDWLAKCYLGFLGLVVVSFVAGFVDVWWEQRQRDKNKRG
ncbi:hypothetical protein ES703_105841 [subsurface metagenome]